MKVMLQDTISRNSNFVGLIPRNAFLQHQLESSPTSHNIPQPAKMRAFLFEPATMSAFCKSTLIVPGSASLCNQETLYGMLTVSQKTESPTVRKRGDLFCPMPAQVTSPCVMTFLKKKKVAENLAWPLALSLLGVSLLLNLNT